MENLLKMSEKKWYDLDEKECIKQVYSKYTIKEFWDFWSDKKLRHMEVRIKDYELIKTTADKFKLPWCSSGVFVCNDVQLKNVIAFVRDKATIWFGAQPRKKNWSSRGWKTFGGKDTNVDEISFIFIDIDRKVKDGPATSEELKDCDIFADMILDRFKTQKWNKGYAKICSGNGIQLFIKLDLPIKLPLVSFDVTEERGKKIHYPIPNDEYEKVRKLITLGVGDEILKFSRKHKKDLNVDVDKTSFRISQVASLPFSKNIKYNGFRWRGIIELKDEENTGLSDYVLSKISNKNSSEFKGIFQVKSTPHIKNLLKSGKLLDNELVKFMLNNKFPDGMINNTIWFQLKALIRDSKYDTSSDEFRKFHAEIKRLHNRSFTMNLPDTKFQFSQDVVNGFCIQNGFNPVYKLWSKRTKPSPKSYRPHKDEKGKIIKDVSEYLTWRDRGRTIFGEPLELKPDSPILEDFKEVKEQMVDDKLNVNKGIAIRFLQGLIKKYGEERAKFYLNFFDRYFNYD